MQSEKKHDIDIRARAQKVAKVAVPALAVCVAGIALAKKTSSVKLRLMEVVEQDLWYGYVAGKWLLETFDGEAVFEVLSAETFDGDLPANEIDNIADDGDSFNLTVNNQTRHAKFLICKKL